MCRDQAELQAAKRILRWSMIGHLQRNKVKDVLRLAGEVQSPARLSLAEAPDRRLQQRGRELDVPVQVNTSGEASKYGLVPDEIPVFLKELSAFTALRPQGFMTLATFTSDQAEVRRCFRLLTDVRDRAREAMPALAELSMGMSGDDRARWAGRIRTASPARFPLLAARAECRLMMAQPKAAIAFRV
jgi:uncharacterized pyridoxal phosphate-containing UPF0001 family protein